MAIAKPSCSVTQNGLGSSSVTISWNLPTGSDIAHIWTSWGLDTWASRGATSYITSIPNVVWDSMYSVAVIVHNYDTGEGSEWSNNAYVTMRPKPAAPLASPPTNIKITKGTGTSFTVSFTKDVNATYTIINKDWLAEGTSGKYIYSTGSSETITVPSKGVTYWLQLASINADGVYSSWVWSPSIFFASRPDNFLGSLYKSKDGGEVVDLAQWNSFASKINEFRVYKGSSGYSFSLASSARIGDNFTASHYNEMLNAMSQISTGLPSAKSSGQSVYKSYFSDLTTSLNNIV